MHAVGAADRHVLAGPEALLAEPEADLVVAVPFLVVEVPLAARLAPQPADPVAMAGAEVGDDVFGVEVNFAAKLGEDLAGPYQIFVTPNAKKALGGAAKLKNVPGGRLGGTKLPYYEALYPLLEEAGPRRAKRSQVRFR